MDYFKFTPIKEVTLTLLCLKKSLEYPAWKKLGLHFYILNRMPGGRSSVVPSWIDSSPCCLEINRTGAEPLFLFRYRNAVHENIANSPSQMLFSHDLRLHEDRLFYSPFDSPSSPHRWIPGIDKGDRSFGKELNRHSVWEDKDPVWHKCNWTWLQ